LKVKILALIFAAIFAVSLTACAGTKKDTASSNSAASSLPTTDRAGNKITVPAKVDRIVSAAPAYTEILQSLGVANKLVAIDKNATDIAGIDKNLPQIDFTNPDIEKIMALKPDLVIVSGLSTDSGKDPFKQLKDAGICVVYIPTSNTLEDVIDDITFVSEITGTQSKGKAIISDMKTQINKISAIGKTIKNKKKVYFEISPDPQIWSFGSGVFLNEMLNIIGATNVLGDKSSWLSVTPEAVVSLNPDVILTNVSYTSDAVGEIESRKGWGNITAIENKQVFMINADASSRPDQNVIKALKQMAKDIYPEQYSSI
jgi:iron complex transport system substrate-binding protein